MSLNLASILRESAAANPNKVAVMLDDFKLTYAELDKLSNQIAQGLADAGLKPGDKVGLMAPNVPQFPIAYYGILKAGGVVVPMNVLLKAPEVAFYLQDSDASRLIVWADFAAEALKGVAEAGRPIDVYAIAPMPGMPVPEGTQPVEALLHGDGRFDAAPTSTEDTAVILYTSGTTGRPKGAELTHFNLWMNCHQAGHLFTYTDDDVAIAMLPLFHSFGQSSIMNSAIHSGATITLVPRFETKKVLDVIVRDRVTIFPGVPTMFFAVLHEPAAAEYDLSTLRICISGGAAIPGEVIQAWEQRYPKAVILEGYGLSETSPTCTFNRSIDERKVLSIGKRIWGVEMKVFDEHDHELPLGPDNVGEIVVRGHNVMKGYYKQPEATAEAFRGGWFHTGDMGYVDEDGFFFIVDRKKELIIRGGFNVYPREVEEVLYAHPAVAEAAVIGVPDERMGEEVKAIVSLKPGVSATAEELIAFTKERVAAYKYPRTIEFIDALPKGATGKILKKELKQQLAAAGRI
jgi:long-chain acyl-CoA synthetase